MKKIAIIGAGISGLFFANLLKNSSEYDFTVIEKRTSIDTEDGYGIQLSVNSIKLLNEIGFNNLDKKEIYNPKKISFINAKNNEEICDLDISKFNYGSNQYTTLKRSTLLKFLLNNISKDKIKLNAELKNLNYEKKLTLSFSDNSTEEFDYLIVSDGVFSKTKSIILNKNIKREYFKSIAVRGNLNDYPNEDISLYLGSNFHFVIYPVNQNKEFNFISIIRKQLSNQQLLDENLYKDENFLKSITQELYEKTAIELDGKLKNIKSFPIYISKKLEISDNKNIFFIGDALFALPPSFAQGASQSIESSKELFDQIENNKDDYYEKRIQKLNSVNWRSKLNYFSFHLSNPIVASFRNSILKVLVKNNKFLDSYLGKIYRD
jgi:salicylate hydroxylase